MYYEHHLFSVAYRSMMMIIHIESAPVFEEFYRFHRQTNKYF